jgi:hypothetical protein
MEDKDTEELLKRVQTVESYMQKKKARTEKALKVGMPILSSVLVAIMKLYLSRILGIRL